MKKIVALLLALASLAGCGTAGFVPESADAGDSGAHRFGAVTSNGNTQTVGVNGGVVIVGQDGVNIASVIDSGTPGQWALLTSATFSGSVTTSDPTNIGTEDAAAPTRAELPGYRRADGTLAAVSTANPLPITGSISATNPSVGTTAAAVPGSATYCGGNQGGNLVGMPAGNATAPFRVDPTGTTTQPVSGTVTANVGTTGGLSLDTSVNGVLNAQGSTTAGESGPLCQGAVTTAAPSYTTAKTSPLSLNPSGGLRVDGSGATQPVSGTLTCNAGTGFSPITANQGTAASLSSKWPVTVTDGTNTMPTGDAVSRAIFHKITDGTNTAAVKPASTTVVATDPALVVAISQNSASITATYSNPTTKAYANATNAGVIKASSGNLFGICVFVYSTSGGGDLLMLFNQTSTPTNGATPVFAFGLQQGGTTGPGWACVDTTTFTLAGYPFGTGIAWAVSTARGTLTLETAANVDFGGATYQ